MKRALFLALGLAALLVSASSARADSDDDSFGGHTSAGGDDFVVDGSQDSDPGSSSSTSDDPDSSPPPPEDVVFTYCWDGSLSSATALPGDDNQVIVTRDCPDFEAIAAAAEREWTTLHPIASQIQLQPNTGWVIATVPTVAMASDAVQTHQATLLGSDVTIRATASGYLWEWGDGEQTATTDPGAPYPFATVTHTYPHAADAATVALTTTWTGEFRVGTSAWFPFDATITSASTPVDLTIYDPRSRLVNCDLQGRCRLASTN